MDSARSDVREVSPAIERVVAWLFLATLVIAGFAAIDALSADPVPETTPADAHALERGRGRARARPRPRAFVLLLDSLRYETATFGDLMPATARLRAKATSARVTPTRDAITVPSIRAAFTGRDSTRILGFVRNFVSQRETMESLFTQLAAHGRHALVYSDGSFDQFGTGFESHMIETDSPDEVRRQGETTLSALATLRAGKADLVIVHIQYTDHVAHEGGIADPHYRSVFAQADQLVARVDAELPADATFVLMGDHGHDAKGRHALGIEAPTFALYRGPRYRAGVDLGTISIRDHRYLLGFALGEPLPPDYAAGRYPRALLSAAPLPADYARNAAHAQASVEGIPAARMFALHAMLAYLSALFAVWLVASGCVPSVQVTRTHKLLSPLLLVPCGFASALPYNALIGVVLVLIWFAALRGRVRAVALLLALVLVAGEALYGLGSLLVALRPYVHEPLYSSLALTWVGLWTAALLLTRWRDDPRVGWALLALPLFLSYPSVYRYGAPAAMAPAWIGWALCAVAVAARPQGASARRLWAERGALLAALFVLLVPFKATDALEFQFTRWHSSPVPDVPSMWFALALFAKLILFVQPRAPRRAHAAALLAVCVLVLGQLERIAPNLQLLAALGAAGVAIAARRHRARHAASRTAPELQRIAGLLALLLLHHALTRAPAVTYYWQDSLLAATLLSARLVRHALAPRERSAAYAALLLLALFAAGWVTFAFTVRSLEWTFLYDWFSAEVVKHDAVLFLPLILARYLIPLLIARRLLAHEIGELVPYPQRMIRALFGAKVISLLFLAYGIGACSVASDVFLEAAQESGIVLLLVAALL